jgi:hypothetical protein
VYLRLNSPGSKPDLMSLMNPVSSYALSSMMALMALSLYLRLSYPRTRRDRRLLHLPILLRLLYLLLT